ncbi:MAG: class I SAM-dependent methyltransferase [Dehalococcoidales bacterium]|nr:class I SAM-dependent methyltransferase [Dehalococcoidales bacterium]
MAGKIALGKRLMIRTFFNQNAFRWDETRSEKDETKLRRMVFRLNIKSGSIVLDAGTGTGVFTPFLLRETGSTGQIIALDLAEKMLLQARAKNFTGNIDYICADITNIPLCNEIFDTIVCYSCFPHFQDKLMALTEMKRVMKGGARLFICHTSSRSEINEIHRQIPGFEMHTIPGEDEMQELLSQAGFIDIKIADQGESYLVSVTKPEIV